MCVDYMHILCYFLYKDLSIHGFWYLQVVLEPIPCRYKVMTEYL